MKKFLILAVVAVMLQSCASIITGKMQTMTFNSTPQGAKVYVDGKTIGVTPITTDVRRKSKNINFAMDGYKDYPLTVKKSGNGWVWGNYIFLPLGLIPTIVGIIIDDANGSGYEIKKIIDNGQKHKIENSTISVELKK